MPLRTIFSLDPPGVPLLAWLPPHPSRESASELSPSGHSADPVVVEANAPPRHQAVNNARQAVRLRDEAGSLAAYFWGWEPPRRTQPLTRAALRAQPTSPESSALAKDLKRRGWAFVGPTTAYAFMQAMGLVNDHVAGCATHARVEDARRAFRKP